MSGEVARFDVRPGGEPETTPVPETNDAPSNPQYYCPPPCTPGCAPGCVSSDTQRVEELALQIRQLNAAVAKLAELKAAEQQEVSSEPVDDLTGDVSYSPPRKTIRRPATRPAPKAPEVDYAALEAEAEAAERQVQFEERYAQKCAELEDTQARMEQIEIQHKQLLEANLQKISADREKRVRDRMGHTQSESKVVQSSYVDEEAPVVAPPKKLPTRPASLKKVPSTLTPVHSVDQVFGVQSNAPDWMRTGE